MRSHFDEQLALLNKNLITMGGLCETIIALAFQSMNEENLKDGNEVKRLDNEIIQKERDIENLCLKLLLQQQPVAKDLRLISAALKMVTDMKRIGDIALDIFEINVQLKNNESVMFHEMSIETALMVTKSVDAFVNSDIILAKEVIKDDDLIDDDFNQTKAELIKKIATDPTDGEYVIDLLMIAKYLEKIGDHAVNISKWMIFAISGQHKED